MGTLKLRRNKRIIFLIALVFSISSIASGFSLYLSHKVDAAEASWNPGRIIDDAVFTDYNSMTADQIQLFLKSKVPKCDNWATGGSTTTARRDYVRSKGFDVPLTCIADFNENGKSAAQIIYDTAQEFKISPKVLLVLIQKEQGLITDDWPLPTQYRSATGYGCPDSTPGVCDGQYYGFTNQVRWASKMFRAIMNNSPTWYTPYILGSNVIQYNPSSSCGSSTVIIENRATQALYNYTPYQPNDAALAAQMGTTVNCGAYGNLNFYRYFTNWFGNPLDTSEDKFEGVSSRTETISYGTSTYSFYYDKINRNISYVKMDANGTSSDIMLDGSSSSGGRIMADVGEGLTALEYGGSLQVFYYDRTNGDLRHAWMTNGSWQFETLDGGGSGSISKYSGSAGMNPSAVVYQDSLQLYYYDKSNGNLRHAWANATGWHFENLDGDVGSVARNTADVGLYSTVTTFGDSLQLYYYDKSNGNLRHAWANATGWHFENLDGDSGSIARNSADVGINPSITSFGDSLQLYYYDKSNGNLRHAWANATGWHFENLDGDVGSVARNTADVGLYSTVTTFGDSLQLYYYDKSNGNLRHAWANATGWHFENLDGDSGSIARNSADVGINPSITSFGDSLQLYYYDKSNGNLRHAWADSTGWHFKVPSGTIFY